MSTSSAPRRFVPADAAALTDLVHAAYAELGAAGLNFTAVDQDEATTLARAEHGATWLLDGDGGLLAAITISFPPSRPLQRLSAEARLPGRAWLNQLAVHPTARGRGLASQLWHTGRAWAEERGASAIGLDTAAPASHLIELYERWGFRQRETIHWPGKTYDSIVMVRPNQPAA